MLVMRLGSVLLSTCHRAFLCFAMALQCTLFSFTMAPRILSCCRTLSYDVGAKGVSSTCHAAGMAFRNALARTLCEYHPLSRMCSCVSSCVSASTCIAAVCKSTSKNCGPLRTLLSACLPQCASSCRSKYRSPHKSRSSLLLRRYDGAPFMVVRAGGCGLVSCTVVRIFFSGGAACDGMFGQGCFASHGNVERIS